MFNLAYMRAKENERNIVAKATERFLSSPGNIIKVIPWGYTTNAIPVSTYQLEE